MKKEIQVQNLKCKGCAGTIQKKMNSIEGIEKVEVIVSSSTIYFEYLKEKQLEMVKESLLKMGYPSIETDNTTSSKVKSYVSCVIGKIQQ
jgi:copper chaperone CopZ